MRGPEGHVQGTDPASSFSQLPTHHFPSLPKPFTQTSLHHFALFPTACASPFPDYIFLPLHLMTLYVQIVIDLIYILLP